MKLKYEILWFEDNDSWFNTLSDAIGEYLEDNGFEMVVHRYENDNKGLMTILKEDDFNLILMDYNLEGQNGDEIIKSIRDLEFYTDIVFYSQNGAQYIRNLVKEQGIDGIFCSSREIREFEGKVNSIIKNTIKKVQDVNNMRGLVIAETIDLESKLANILKEYFKVIKEEDVTKAQIFKSICDKKKEQILNDGKIISVIEEKHINELIDENVLTTYNLYTSIQSVLKNNIKELNVLLNSGLSTEEKEQITHKKDLLSSIKSKISNFEKDIIFTRNTLAHVKEMKNLDTGISYLESINRNGTSIIFDDKKYVEIRKNLMSYNTNLNELYEYFLIDIKMKESTGQ
ncbi:MULTISPECIES: response regulator [Bacillus]|uniref:response regulator n=1 Tax=Bacillus TaxID=1386 RepID=UPI001BA90DF2|nr:hypothetical protein [Bacillus cereus]